MGQSNCGIECIMEPLASGCYTGIFAGRLPRKCTGIIKHEMAVQTDAIPAPNIRSTTPVQGISVDSNGRPTIHPLPAPGIWAR